MVTKEEVRPLYCTFQGSLSQAPDGYKIKFISKALGSHYNVTIERLNKLDTNKQYSDFSLTEEDKLGGGYETYIYRTKLGGLIEYLHGEYFSDEPAPFSGMPATVVTQTALQNQSVDVMVNNIHDLLDKKINESEDGSKQKGFLEKVKGKLSSVKDVMQLITILLSTAKDSGISIQDLLDIFS